MKIDFLCNDGSPIGIVFEDIFERGVGGAELALLSLAEEFARRGMDVNIYNNPRQPSVHPDIRFRPIANFGTDGPHDNVIVFRSPNERIDGIKANRLIWWSTDQYTVGNFGQFAPKVEFCVTISPFHTEYHKKTYHIKNVGHIDLGVRNEYNEEIEKKPSRLIFCSVPDRGLKIMHAAWPLIKEQIPDAELVITSDYRLWGLKDPRNHAHRLMWTSHEDISFFGMVPRKQLVELQLSSDIVSYPCIYEELFCISVAECQVAGAYPVTSEYGALATTNEFGTKINGDPRTPIFVKRFTDEIIDLLKNRGELEKRQREMIKAARERFSWKIIADRWLKLFENGGLE